MIIRIVRMSFKPDKVADFLNIFKASKSSIRAFEGCNHLSIYRDLHHSNIYFTVSHWETADNLETYRQSELFKSTWAKVKPFFEDAPRAYSLGDFEY